MKKIISIVFSLVFFFVTMMTPVLAGSSEYVKDELMVLHSDVLQSYQQRAEQLSDRYQFGVYVHLIYDEDSYDDINTYIENYYADQDLGYGDSHDGILFLIAQSSRGGSFDILVPGNSSHQFFTISGLEEIQDRVIDYLYDHDYEGAVNAYLNAVTAQFTAYDQTGTAWTPQNDPVRVQNRKATRLGITLIGGPLLSLMIVLIMKGKNKTKFIATTAEDYHSRLSLTNSRDMFLYRTVSRTRIQHDRSSSSGGGFTSSSGGMHSGGGHF